MLCLRPTAFELFIPTGWATNHLQPEMCFPLNPMDEWQWTCLIKIIITTTKNEHRKKLNIPTLTCLKKCGQNLFAVLATSLDPTLTRSNDVSTCSFLNTPPPAYLILYYICLFFLKKNSVQLWCRNVYPAILKVGNTIKADSPTHPSSVSLF